MVGRISAAVVRHQHPNQQHHPPPPINPFHEPLHQMSSLESWTDGDDPLHPCIWAKLPRDIIYNIIDQSDLLTQVSWSNTGLEFSPYTRAKMWKEHRTNQSSDQTSTESVTALLSSWGELQKMRTLSIGQLVYQEAKGLAQLVVGLEITKLRVDCCEVCKISDGNDTSPLVPFLRALRRDTRISDGPRTHGLPETLTTLWLTDLDHVNISSLYQSLAKAVVPFKALVRITITFCLTANADEEFERMELPHIDEDTAHESIGVRFWSSLSYDKPVKMLSHYDGRPGQDSYRVQMRSGFVAGEWLEVTNLAKTMDDVIANRPDDIITSRTMRFIRLPNFPDNAIVIYPCLEVCHRDHPQHEPVPMQ